MDAKGESFLGTVNMIGVCYTDSHVATGFGAHLARPLFREKQYDDMPEAEVSWQRMQCRTLLEPSKQTRVGRTVQL